MKTKSVDGVITVSVFHIAANGMPDVGRMYADLIFSACFQLKFYQRMGGGAVENTEMCNGIFAAIIYRRGINEITSLNQLVIVPASSITSPDTTAI